MLKVRAGRLAGCAAGSVQDLRSAPVSLQISRTDTPDGPALDQAEDCQPSCKCIYRQTAAAPHH